MSAFRFDVRSQGVLGVRLLDGATASEAAAFLALEVGERVAAGVLCEARGVALEGAEALPSAERWGDASRVIGAGAAERTAYACAYAPAPVAEPEASAVVERVERRRGVAGSFSLVARVRYGAEAAHRVEFVSSVYGGPIVMVLESGAQCFVSSAVVARLGSTLSESWVRSFFA